MREILPISIAYRGATSSGVGALEKHLRLVARERVSREAANVVSVIEMAGHHVRRPYNIFKWHYEEAPLKLYCIGDVA